MHFLKVYLVIVLSTTFSQFYNYQLFLNSDGVIRITVNIIYNFSGFLTGVCLVGIYYLLVDIIFSNLSFFNKGDFIKEFLTGLIKNKNPKLDFFTRSTLYFVPIGSVVGTVIGNILFSPKEGMLFYTGAVIISQVICTLPFWVVYKYTGMFRFTKDY